MSNLGALVQHHPNPLHAQNPEESRDALVEQISFTLLDFNHSWEAVENSEVDKDKHKYLFHVTCNCFFWLFNVFQHFRKIH